MCCTWRRSPSVQLFCSVALNVLTTHAADVHSIQIGFRNRNAWSAPRSGLHSPCTDASRCTLTTRRLDRVSWRDVSSLVTDVPWDRGVVLMDKTVDTSHTHFKRYAAADVEFGPSDNRHVVCIQCIASFYCWHVFTAIFRRRCALMLFLTYCFLPVIIVIIIIAVVVVIVVYYHLAKTDFQMRFLWLFEQTVQILLLFSSFLYVCFTAVFVIISKLHSLSYRLILITTN